MEKNKTMLPASLLSKFRIILCRPSHSGNIGSSARAMKTMGITKLYLVDPKGKIDDHAIALSSGAADVLAHAKCVQGLEEALEGVQMACALTSRRRELSSPLNTPREAVAQCLEIAANGGEIALVFGNETFGLSIEESSLCNQLITIPGNPDYFSLNLSQAVQVLCYEVYQQVNNDIDYLKPDINLASREHYQGFYTHLEQSLEHIQFFERRQKDRLMRRFKCLFDRAKLQREEIDILRGVCKQMEKLSIKK